MRAPTPNEWIPGVVKDTSQLEGQLYMRPDDPEIHPLHISKSTLFQPKVGQRIEISHSPCGSHGALIAWREVQHPRGAADISTEAINLPEPSREIPTFPLTGLPGQHEMIKEVEPIWEYGTLTGVLPLKAGNVIQLLTDSGTMMEYAPSDFPGFDKQLSKWRVRRLTVAGVCSHPDAREEMRRADTGNGQPEQIVERFRKWEVVPWPAGQRPEPPVNVAEDSEEVRLLRDIKAILLDIRAGRGSDHPHYKHPHD